VLLQEALGLLPQLGTLLPQLNNLLIHTILFLRQMRAGRMKMGTKKLGQLI
jgi:hypothetical protein